MEFIEQLIASLQTDGNAFALTVRDDFGYPVEFWPLDPRSVAVSRNPQTRDLTYTVEGRPLTAWDVLHVPGFRIPGQLRGLSPIEWCKSTFGIAQATEEYAANFFANGANPGSVIELTGDPGEAAIRAMAQRWRRAHGGVKKSHLPGILTHGATWKPVSIPNDQAQFLETRKFSRSEIAGIFRVPPHMIGDLEKATFSNIEHQGIDFVRYSLNPWLERLELRFNMLLPRGEFVKFNPDKLLRGDTRNRYAAHASALQSGWLSVNEVRRTEDLPGIGPAGDEYRPMAPVGPSAGGGGGDPLNNNGGEPKDEE